MIMWRWWYRDVYVGKCGKQHGQVCQSSGVDWQIVDMYCGVWSCMNVCTVIGAVCI